MKSSLIITTYNEESSIENLLDDLVKQTMLPDEIIFIDGGSSDNTTKIISGFKSLLNINLILSPKLNKKFHTGPIAAARNLGISQSRNCNIIVTDAGCRVDKNFVKFMSKALESNLLVAGKYEANSGNSFQKKLERFFIPGEEKFLKSSFLPSSRSIAFKKECWETVNGYPENSYTAEDTLFAIRLRENFGDFYKEKNAIVYWDLPKDVDELKSKLINYSIGDRIQGLDKWKYFVKKTLVSTRLSYLYSYIKLGDDLIHIFYSAQIKGYYENTIRS